MNKSLKDKAIKFKGKDYVEVKERILYLADVYEGAYSINTDYDYFPERKMWVVKAKLAITSEGNVVTTYTGLAQEIEDSSFINKTSALENAETSAVGRACAMAGIGVIDGIASIDEINKATNRTAAPSPVIPDHNTLIKKLKASKTEEELTKVREEVGKWFDLYPIEKRAELTKAKEAQELFLSV